MKQRPSQPRPSRRFRWRETPVARYYLKRAHMVREAFVEHADWERTAREKMMRDFPPYPQHLVDELGERRVQFIREGSSWEVQG